MGATAPAPRAESLPPASRAVWRAPYEPTPPSRFRWLSGAVLVAGISLTLLAYFVEGRTGAKYAWMPAMFFIAANGLLDAFAPKDGARERAAAEGLVDDPAEPGTVPVALSFRRGDATLGEDRGRLAAMDGPLAFAGRFTGLLLAPQDCKVRSYDSVETNAHVRVLGDLLVVISPLGDNDKCEAVLPEWDRLVRTGRTYSGPRECPPEDVQPGFN